MELKKKKLFVYGTLKKGKRLHLYIRDSKFLGEKTIEGYTLFDIGYPLAVKSKDKKIKGELYEVDEKAWKTIKMIEETAGYKITNIGDIYFYEYPASRLYPNIKHIGEEWN